MGRIGDDGLHGGTDIGKRCLERYHDGGCWRRHTATDRRCVETGYRGFRLAPFGGLVEAADLLVRFGDR